MQRLTELRGRRDNDAVESALQRLRNAAASSDNLMPFILESAEALATLGEISDAMRDVFGTYTERHGI